MTIVIGYGTIALVMPDPAYVEGGQLRGGSNVAALALAHALGGDLFLGFACAVAFATILAVVAGLTLAAAAGVSHDLYSAALRRHRASEQDELRVSRIAALAFGAVGIGLSIVFQSENITTLVVISFSIAASATFPVLALCLYWGGLTTAGALAGGLTGLTAAIVLTILSPTVWVAVLGFAAPLFPYQYPTIVSMPLAFAAAILVSMAPVRAAEPS
jgi:cation/acetate symporter